MDNLGFKIIFQGTNLQRLLSGLLITLKISLLSILISIVLGTIFGITMTSRKKIIKICAKIYLETIRMVPIIVWLFIFYFGVARLFNINSQAQSVSVFVFSLWGTAEMGDIVRGAITSIPSQQTQSAKAIGLSDNQIYRYIIIPQSIRRMLPSAINLSTRMIKTTSLVVLIGVVEVLKVGQQIIENSSLKNPSSPFWIYGLIFFFYFIICYPISLLSKKLEQIWKD